MKRNITIIVTCLFLVIGCAHHSENRPPIVPAVTQIHQTPNFNTLVVNGSTNVAIVNGPSSVIVYGYPSDISQVGAHIANHALYIDNTNNRVKITVSTPGLASLSVFGNATVTSNNFKTDNLEILAQDQGSLKLEGEIGTNKIYQHGAGKIDLAWASCGKVIVDSQAPGPIYLAGTANYLKARLTNNATMDARYLRAQNAAIFTTNSARADVLVLNTLGAFAIDTSTINYYKNPNHLTVATKGSGNVLHPDWIK